MKLDSMPVPRKGDVVVLYDNEGTLGVIEKSLNNHWLIVLDGSAYDDEISTICYPEGSVTVCRRNKFEVIDHIDEDEPKHSTEDMDACPSGRYMVNGQKVLIKIHSDYDSHLNQIEGPTIKVICDSCGHLIKSIPIEI